MSIGERGGSTATAEQGFNAIDVFKHTIADQVRLDILGWLGTHDEWHRDDLRIPLSPADKNVLGAVVNGLLKSGTITETGERRKSCDPASHGRKSGVYKLQRSGCGAPGNSLRVDECGPVGGPVKNGQGVGESPARTGGSQVEKKTSVASSSGSPDAGNLGFPARLFEVERVTDHYRGEAA